MSTSRSTRTRWLSTKQQRAWRAYLAGTMQLTARLDRDLDEQHGLSLSEYEILVRLSEAGQDGRLRMAELADSLNHSRSRLTHTVARLEADGLVARWTCDSDRRGVFCAITGAGFARLEEAAPTHVEGVRRYLVDAVAPEDFDAVGRVFTAVSDAICEGSGGARPWPAGAAR